MKATDDDCNSCSIIRDFATNLYRCQKVTRQGGVRLDKLRMGLGRQQRGNVSPRGGFWIERNPFHPCIDRPVVNIAWLTSVFIDQNLSPTSITLNGIVLDCSNEMFYCVHFDRLNKTFNWKGCFSRQNANSGCVSEWGGYQLAAEGTYS